MKLKNKKKIIKYIEIIKKNKNKLKFKSRQKYAKGEKSSCLGKKAKCLVNLKNNEKEISLFMIFP